MKTFHLICAFTLILAALFMTGCSMMNNNPYHGEFILDNPTESAISVTVDGKKYDLAAYQYKKLTLDVGRHSMTTPYNETIDFIVTVENNGGVLNPTHSVYYLYNILYVREDYDKATQRFSDIVIDGIEYEVPARAVMGVLIDERVEDWQFPIHTPFDDVAYVDRDEVVAATRYKLFSKKELIDFLEEGTEYVGYHEANKIKTDSHLPYYEPKKEVVFFVPDFKNTEAKRLATEMVELDKAFGKAETADQQKDLLKKYRNLWKSYVEEGLKEEYDAAEYEKKAQLEFHNFTKGAIIL